MIFEYFTLAKVLRFGGLLDVRRLTHVEIFAPFKQVWSLCFLCTTPSACDEFVWFFCLAFRNGIKAFARFIECRIYNYWKWLALRGEHRKRKIDNMALFTQSRNLTVLFCWHMETLQLPVELL